MLKWILIGVALCFVGGCTLIAGSAYWLVSRAKATPEFYEQVEPVELTEEARAQSKAELKSIASTVVPGFLLEEPSEHEAQVKDDLDETIPVVDGADPTDAEVGTADPIDKSARKNATSEDAASKPEDVAPVLVPTELAFTEEQLNTYAMLLVESLDSSQRRLFSAPRIKLVENSAQLGFRLNLPDMSGVIGLKVTPEVRGPKEIAFLIDTVSLGRVAIPVEQALMSADINADDLPEGIRIPDGVSPPQLIVSWETQEDIATEIDSATIEEGQVKVRLFVTPETKSDVDTESTEGERPADADLVPAA